MEVTWRLHKELAGGERRSPPEFEFWLRVLFVVNANGMVHMALVTCELSRIANHRRGGVLHLGVALEDLLRHGGIVDVLAGDLQHIASLDKVNDQRNEPAQENGE